MERQLDIVQPLYFFYHLHAYTRCNVKQNLRGLFYGIEKLDFIIWKSKRLRRLTSEERGWRINRTDHKPRCKATNQGDVSLKDQIWMCCRART